MGDSRASSKDDGYTPEQHLVAAVSEFKKLEASNQSYMERMYHTLSSPFKVTTKPCESHRQEVLRCYEGILAGGSSSTGSGGAGEGGADGAAVATAVSAEDTWQLPLQRCYHAAKEYEQCVERRTLSEHLALASTFEAKRIAAQARAIEQTEENERLGRAEDAAARVGAETSF